MASKQDPTAVLAPEEATSAREEYPLRRVVEAPSGPVAKAPARAVFSPSELFILRNMPWSSQELNGVVRVQVHDLTAHGWRTPDESGGIERAVMEAILANEEAGAIRLRSNVVRKDGFFGPSFSTALLATPEHKTARWPSGSLEGTLREQVVSETKVSDLVYGWIGMDSGDPRVQALQPLMERFVAKGVLELESVQKRALKIFHWTSKHYVLPERTATLMERGPARLADAHPQNRPEVREQLIGEINDGFNRRVEQSDGGD